MENNPAHFREAPQPKLLADADNPELLKELYQMEPKIIISTIPNEEVNELIIKSAPPRKRKIFILTAKTKEEAKRLYELGADYVLLPYHLTGKFLATILDLGIKIKRIRKIHKKELKRLRF